MLGTVLLHRVGQGDRLLADYDRPLAALAGHVREVLGSEYALGELVREADAEWGARPRRAAALRPAGP